MDTFHITDHDCVGPDIELETRDQANASPDLASGGRLADALVRLLADWWRRHANEPADDTQG